jgi:hypothetical protein
MYVNAKMIPGETVLGIGGGRMKEQWRGLYDILDAL